MIDPGPCIWPSWNFGATEMHRDLDMLEIETGLKNIEYALFTHYHGDHVQFSGLLKERYGTLSACPADIAKLLRDPEKYPYPCMLNWYGFPFGHIDTDMILDYGDIFRWRNVPVKIIRTPGHCFAHAGYFLEWKGLRIVCTGDTMQYGSGPISVGLPVIYNDAAWPEKGFLKTFETIAALNPELILGGHGHSCFDHDGSILRDFINASKLSLSAADGMVYPGSLFKAMTPPFFPGSDYL